MNATTEKFDYISALAGAILLMIITSIAPMAQIPAAERDITSILGEMVGYKR